MIRPTFDPLVFCCDDADVVRGIRDFVDDDDVGRSMIELLLPSFDKPLTCRQICKQYTTVNYGRRISYLIFKVLHGKHGSADVKLSEIL